MEPWLGYGDRPALRKPFRRRAQPEEQLPCREVCRLSKDLSRSLIPLPGLAQDLEATLFLRDIDADARGNPAPAVFLQPLIGLQLQHAKHRVRERMVVRRATTCLKHAPRIAYGRQCLRIGNRRHEIEAAAG